jgi:methylmalonyl-CoA/ethylmalonyl-CoA epimerase
MNLSDASIAQIMIPVEDFDRGVAFYRDVLGFQFLFSAPPQMAFFLCGSVRLLVGVMAKGQQPARGSTIYFQVADIADVTVTLKTQGVSFVQEPHLVHRSETSALWLAEFTDPDGNHLALMSEVPLEP